MDNIILIGMPGVGKSTVGVLLAKILGMGFADTDLVIQEKTGELLKSIIEREGALGFIKCEEAVCADFNASRSVIATGGSVVYGSRAMDHFRSVGTVVYLEQSFEVIEKRLSDIRGRGVVLKDGQTLHDIYEERCPLYEKYADVIVRLGDGSIEESVEKVIDALERYAPVR